MSKRIKKIALDEEEQAIENSLESMALMTGHTKSRIVKIYKEAAKKYLTKKRRVP
jgi:hypothetical protein